MGWSSGTELMRRVIQAIKPLTHGIDQTVLDNAVKTIIEGFEHHDWNCQNEMLEYYDFYDRAYFLHSPYDHGYHAAMLDEVAISIPKPVNKKDLKLWIEGYEEKLDEG